MSALLRDCEMQMLRVVDALGPNKVKAAISVQSWSNLNRSSWRFDELRTRVAEELRIFIYHRRGLLICTSLFIMWYIPLGVMRNIAYYRHTPGDNLPDIAYDFINDQTSDITKGNIEVCFFSLMLSLVALAGIGNIVYQPPQMPRVFVTNALYKAICCLHGGMILRGLVFNSTSIPGSASHCHPAVDSMYWKRKPKSLLQCFTFINLTRANCGDLIFSGHVFSTLLMISFLRNATRSIFGWYPRLHQLLFLALYPGALCYCYIIVAVRNHYSMDILLSFIFTPIYLHAFDKF